MTMLSRVAERLYWMARYLERAENIARVTHRYSHMIMDMPKSAAPGWDLLIRILDADPLFQQKYRAYNEQNVLKFMITDLENPGGVLPCIKAVRENVRTSRDVLPIEAWEYVNELYLYADEHADTSVSRRHRYRYLEKTITRCQSVNGLFTSSLARDHAYRFIRLGQLIERADMTTRIIDVGAAALLSEDRPHETVDPLIWSCLLRSLSAMGAYRHRIGPQVDADSVVDFVLRDDTLPRSVRFCLNGMREELQPLKNKALALKLLDKTRRKVSRFDCSVRSRKELHDYIDQFQVSLFHINQAIDETWFLGGEA